MDTLSEKIENFKYAPGLATYGIDGKAGAQGLQGNGIFYTNYDLANLTDHDDLKSIIIAILGSKVLIRNTDIELTRKYINGDNIICTNGKIFKIINIENYSVNADLSSATAYLDFFEFVGEIGTLSDSDYFNSVSGESESRLAINAKNYSGFDITDIANDTTADTDSREFGLRIISNNKDKTGSINFLSLISRSGVSDDNYLNISFDTLTSTFHMKSDCPIMLDAEKVEVNAEDETSSYDGYSPVMTSESTMTSFYNSCKHVSCSVSSKNVLTFTFDTNAVTTDDFSSLLCGVYFKDSTHIMKTPEIVSSALSLDSSYIDSSVIAVSFLKNVEVFLTFAYK